MVLAGNLCGVLGLLRGLLPDGSFSGSCCCGLVDVTVGAVGMLLVFVVLVWIVVHDGCLVCFRFACLVGVGLGLVWIWSGGIRGVLVWVACVCWWAWYCVYCGDLVFASGSVNSVVFEL